MPGSVQAWWIFFLRGSQACCKGSIAPVLQTRNRLRERAPHQRQHCRQTVKLRFTTTVLTEAGVLSSTPGNGHEESLPSVPRSACLLCRGAELRTQGQRTSAVFPKFTASLKRQSGFRCNWRSLFPLPSLCHCTSCVNLGKSPHLHSDPLKAWQRNEETGHRIYVACVRWEFQR